jgi:hypothetical protein
MELENEDINFKFKNPEEYINKLDELNGGMKVLLDELKKLYVTTLMEPDNQQVRAKYQDTMSNINLTQSKILSMSNDLQTNMDDINKELSKLDRLIKIEKDRNKKLKTKLGIIENKNNSALEMISDYKEIYNIQYLRNWALFLSTIICIYTISSVYNKPVVKIQPAVKIQPVVKTQPAV